MCDDVVNRALHISCLSADLFVAYCLPILRILSVPFLVLISHIFQAACFNPGDVCCATWQSGDIPFLNSLSLPPPPARLPSCHHRWPCVLNGCMQKLGRRKQPNRIEESNARQSRFDSIRPRLLTSHSSRALTLPLLAYLTHRCRAPLSSRADPPSMPRRLPMPHLPSRRECSPSRHACMRACPRAHLPARVTSHARTYTRATHGARPLTPAPPAAPSLA